MPSSTSSLLLCQACPSPPPTATTMPRQDSYTLGAHETGRLLHGRAGDKKKEAQGHTEKGLSDLEGLWHALSLCSALGEAHVSVALGKNMLLLITCCNSGEEKRGGSDGKRQENEAEANEHV